MMNSKLKGSVSRNPAKNETYVINQPTLMKFYKLNYDQYIICDISKLNLTFFHTIKYAYGSMYGK